MKPDEFECELQRRPLRSVPPEWRAEILSGLTSRTGRQGLADRRAALGTAVMARLREILWPAPTAWAGLAAIWLLTFALNEAGAFESSSSAATIGPSPRAVVVALREHHREVNELLEAPAALPAESPDPAPDRPRSSLSFTNHLA
jgi:hypothetical protein